ncbi:ROK family protein [Alicyclobacillus pomorum]|uniref:ROK family protein n=1 Tax=Alicyclobacillus pomorum TaxID=204470 RepID=UPI00040CED7F|nr:ROK family protein [Alicyclobacillus pomorum]
MEYSIGIDIGGTKIAGAIVHQEGRIVTRKTVPTPEKGRHAVLQSLRLLLDALLEEAARLGVNPLVGIGIGTAGQIDFARGRVLSGTTNIPDWNDVPLRDILSESYDLPVWVDNDVNVMALAERSLGAAKGHDDVVCLALGTGVGGGVISGGHLVRGAWGGACELGHITVDMNGPDCSCGFRGCLEAYASGVAIARRMKHQLALAVGDADTPAVRAYHKDPDCVTSRAVFQWFKEGDPLATAVISETVQALAFGVVTLIHTFNPTIVVLGGGVMEDGEWLRALVERQVRTLGVRSLVDPVQIVLSTHGADAGVLGAAYQCFTYGTPQASQTLREYR